MFVLVITDQRNPDNETTTVIGPFETKQQSFDFQIPQKPGDNPLDLIFYETIEMKHPKDFVIE